MCLMVDEDKQRQTDREREREREIETDRISYKIYIQTYINL